MPTFAFASDGSLTGFEDATPTLRLCVAKAKIDKNPHFIGNTTQQGDGKDSVFTASKRLAYGIQGDAWYQTTADAGVNYDFVHLTDNQASLAGSLFGRTSVVILVRDTSPLIDTTAAEDAVPITEWEAPNAIWHGSTRGYLQSTETILDGDDNNPTLSTFTIPLGTNTVSAEAVFSEVGPDPADFRRSGPILVSYRYRLSGPVTDTNTPFAIDSWTAVINLDNGQTMTGLVVLSQLRVDLDYRKGGPVPFKFKGMFAGTVTFT